METLTLPTELTIYTVGELHPQWLAWLSASAGADTGAAASVQGAPVDQVDGAGLQLLLALHHSLQAQGRALHWLGASDALRSAAAALGLEDSLGLSGGQDAPAASDTEVCA